MTANKITIDLCRSASDWRTQLSSALLGEALTLEIINASLESLVSFLEIVGAPAYSYLILNFVALDLSFSGIGELDVRGLAHLTNLTELNLANNEIGDVGARELAKSPHLAKLTKLNLANTNIGEKGARALAKSPHLANLTTLDLSANKIGDDGVLELAYSPYLTKLTELNLSDNSFDCELALELADSPYLTSLTKLNLSENGIDYEWTRDLARLPHLAKLTELNLSDNAIGYAGARELAKSPHLANLTKLNLANTNIGERGARALAESPHLANLTTLDLSANKIGDDGILELASSPYLTKLTELNLATNQFGETYSRWASLADIRALAESPLLANLTALDLSLNQIAKAGAWALARSPRLTNLIALDLSFNEIGEAGARALAKSPHLAKLTELNLASNQIGDTGARTLAASYHLTNLIALDLGQNRIGAEGAQALASTYNFTNLTKLDLSFNEIGDAGVRALAKSPYLAKLTELKLASNQIGDDGVLALAESPHLANLTTLDLSANEIGDVGAWALLNSKFLRNNLQKLELDNNDLSLPVFRNPSIWRYRREYQIRKWLKLEPLLRVRVLLLGVPRVGKSTLFDALTGKEYQFGDQLRTQGFQRGLNTELAKSVVTRDNRVFDFQCDIWDLGGDTLQHMLHSLFMRPNSLYVMVLNQYSTNNPQPVYDWLDQLAYQTTGVCELIPVVNPRVPVDTPVDLKALNTMLNAYQPDPRSHRSNGVEPVRRSHFTIKDLVEVTLIPDQQDLNEIQFALRQCLKTYRVTEYLEVHNQLADIVRKWNQKRDENYLLYSEFVKRLSADETAQAAYEAYIEQVQQEAREHDTEIANEGQKDFFERAVAYLDQIGIVYYLADLACVVLNPDWVSHGLYALLPPPEDDVRGDEVAQRFRERMMRPHPVIGLQGVFGTAEAFAVLTAMAKAKFQQIPLKTETEQLFKIICHPTLNLVIDLKQVGRPDHYFMPVYLDNPVDNAAELPHALIINRLFTAFNVCAYSFSLQSLYWPPYFIYQHMVWCAGERDKYDLGSRFNYRLILEGTPPAKDHYWLQAVHDPDLKVEIVFWQRQLWCFGHIKNRDDKAAILGFLEQVKEDLNFLLARLTHHPGQSIRIKHHVPCPKCLERNLSANSSLTIDSKEMLRWEGPLTSMGLYSIEDITPHLNKPDTTLTCPQVRSHTRNATAILDYLFTRNFPDTDGDPQYDEATRLKIEALKAIRWLHQQRRYDLTGAGATQKIAKINNGTELELSKTELKTIKEVFIAWRDHPDIKLAEIIHTELGVKEEDLFKKDEYLDPEPLAILFIKLVEWLKWPFR